MKYAYIVQYIKENHISWDTDIFDILKDYTSQLPPVEKNKLGEEDSTLTHKIKGEDSSSAISDSLLEVSGPYQMPPNGEYSFEDIIELLSR